MKKILLLVALLISVSAKAQKPLLGELEQYINVADLLPDNVDVQGATQGFAIHGHYGFSMHDKGQCVIIDLKRKEVDKLESRLLGEVSITSDMQMTTHLWQKVKRN